MPPARCRLGLTGKLNVELVTMPAGGIFASRAVAGIVPASDGGQSAASPASGSSVIPPTCLRDRPASSQRRFWPHAGSAQA